MSINGPAHAEPMRFQASAQPAWPLHLAVRQGVPLCAGVPSALDILANGIRDGDCLLGAPGTSVAWQITPDIPAMSLWPSTQP